MDVFNADDRVLIGSLKSDILQARKQLTTLFQEARNAASMGATASQLAVSGGGIATIPCGEALLMGSILMLGGACASHAGLTTAREKTLQHRQTVQRLVDLERELRQALGNAMADDICLRAYLEEEGIAYADMS